MKLYQCPVCLGVYRDPQADGSAYFHVCPPTPTDAKGGTTARPDARDENLIFDEDGRVNGIKAMGAGRISYTSEETAQYLAALAQALTPPAPTGLLTRALAAASALIGVGNHGRSE